MKIKILKNLIFNNNGQVFKYSEGDILQATEEELKAFSLAFAKGNYWTEYTEAPVIKTVNKDAEEFINQAKTELAKEKQEFEADKIAFQEAKAQLFEKQKELDERAHKLEVDLVDLGDLKTHEIEFNKEKAEFEKAKAEFEKAKAEFEKQKEEAEKNQKKSNKN